MFGFPIGFPEKIRLKDLKILKKKLTWIEKSVTNFHILN